MKKMISTNKDNSVLLANFEEIVDTAPVFTYGENTVEFPGVCIIQKENTKGFLSALLNPGIERIEVEEKVFEDITAIIETLKVDKSRVFQETKVRPVKTSVVNLNALERNAIFTRFTEDTILVNDYVFTNNETEFHGDGMFTSKKVFFVGFELLGMIKNLFEVDGEIKAVDK